MSNVKVEDLQSKLEEIDKPIPKPIKTLKYRVFNETWSPTIGKLAEALSKAQGAMSNGLKQKQGYGYKYMELSTLIDIVRPALSKNGLAVIQTHELIKGTNPSLVTHTSLIHNSGEWMKSSLEMPIKAMPQLSPAQNLGCVASYGRRYSLQALCLIASEEDTDASLKTI